MNQANKDKPKLTLPTRPADLDRRGIPAKPADLDRQKQESEADGPSKQN
mgnify:FL=1